jgi:hypothetical protein
MAAGVPALALAQAQPMYGPSITAENAKKIAPAAIAEAKKNNWTMAVAIVDTHGELVYFERMDEVQQGSVDIAATHCQSGQNSLSLHPQYNHDLFMVGKAIASKLGKP